MLAFLFGWGLLAFATLAAFYFMIGYPLLLLWFPGKTRPVAKNLDFKPTVSVLLAVHNGASFLRPKLDSLLALDYPADRFEILVLSDGSTDETESIAAEYVERGVQCIRLPRGGKPAALNAGIRAAKGEILFFTDVRQKVDPAALTHLVANFADPTVGAVTGELKILHPGQQAQSGEQENMDLYWRYELWVRRRHSALDSLFNTTGCLYAMRASLAMPLPLSCLGDDAVLPLNAYRAGYRIIFEPLSIAYDYATKTGGEWKRRQRTLGGMWQVVRWHPDVFFPPRRMWLHFISHKLGRLLLPWLLILIAVATLLLPAGLPRTLLLCNEALFLFLVLADPWLRSRTWLKRLSSPAHTFAIMNLASLCSISVLFKQPAAIWTPTNVGIMPRKS
jgi:cellulose synthase/poly-beta-1,6-N-acetylglucosamine synthase-like glycosyltransferase